MNIKVRDTKAAGCILLIAGFSLNKVHRVYCE